jgi:hypothetical protein
MKWNWGTGMAATYIAFAAATVAFVAFAMQRPVSLVRPDYYAESLREDQQIAARANARALGASVSVTHERAREVQVMIPRSHATSARGSILLYRASDPAADRTFALALDAAGTQQLRLHDLAAGHWLIKVHWTSSGRAYHVEQPVTLR